MSKGLFGGMFDLNRDGEMDSFEKAAELAFLFETLKEEEGLEDEFIDPELLDLMDW